MSYLAEIWDFIVTIVEFILSAFESLILFIGLLFQSIEYASSFLVWLPPAFGIFALVFISIYVIQFIIGVIKK